MYFLIEDDDLLKTYNTIWDKVSSDIMNEFDSESVYNKICLKTKVKSHGDEVTDFLREKIPKVGSNHTCLAVITLDSALKKDDNYYLQVLLKECKYIEEKEIRDLDNLSDFCSFGEFFVNQVPLNLITPKKNIFCSLKRTLGIKEKFTATDCKCCIILKSAFYL